MAPHSDDGRSNKQYKPRTLIIGAGSRGCRYARELHDSGLGIVAAVAEPVHVKRSQLGSRHIWGRVAQPDIGQSFENWQEFVDYEKTRRADAAAGKRVPSGVDSAFICVLDHQHVDVIRALAPFGLHIMCEKPLATTLEDCLGIYTALLPARGEVQSKIFGIGHVLRYSPHNMLLRRLVLEDELIGHILSLEHTEPVGWWHYSHSYVRGNWRRESTSAPSLLTKSCHDIDWILWMLCSPPVKHGHREAHLPELVSSTGSLTQFRKGRKPKAAGAATNCLSCPIERSCLYSAPKIYYESQMVREKELEWPLNIINPEIEACYTSKGEIAAKELLMGSLAEDYTDQTSEAEKTSRSWYGRCVWECDNDVCDDQFVTLAWDNHTTGDECPVVLNAKTATFHMIAGTEKQCERRGRIYGDKGEIEYDGTTIRVYDFASETAKKFTPPRSKGGHGGGDGGLVRQFLSAVIDTETQQRSAEEAQIHHLGCTVEEIVRSHAMVFAAEEARRERKVLSWKPWWTARLGSVLKRENTAGE